MFVTAATAQGQEGVRVAPQAKACPPILKTLLSPAIEKTMKRAAAAYPIDSPNPVVRAVRATRDGVRKGLQRLQGRRIYPVIAVDDATPARARALAEGTFGKPRAENVDLAEIGTDFENTLKYVEDYQRRTQEFADETATLVAQRDQIKRYLATPENKRPATIEFPKITTREGGEPEVLIYEYKPWDAKSLANQKAELDARIRDRIGPNWKKPLRLPGTPPNEADKLALDQAIQLKRLETFRAEFEIMVQAHPETTIPDNMAALLKKTDALYEGPVGGKVKQAYRPPETATNRLHWLQFRGEGKSLLFKEAQFKLSDEQRKSIIEYIRNMPKAEQQALGVADVADAVGLLRRAKWGRLAGSVTGMGVSVWAGVPALYEFAISDATKKQNCAAIINSEDYGDCVVDYLADKFPVKYLLEVNGNPSFFGKDGKISDPKILAEMTDIGKRRDKLFRKNNRQAEVKDSIITNLRDKSLGDDAYRFAMIESADEDTFRKKLIGATGETPVEGYLAFKYPTAYEKHGAKVFEILSATNGSPEQQKKLAELRQLSLALAQDLDEILYQRQQFLQYGSSQSGYRTYPGSGGYGSGGYGSGGYGSGGYGNDGYGDDANNPPSGSDTSTGNGNTIPVPQAPRDRTGGSGYGGAGSPTDPRNPLPGIPRRNAPRDRGWIKQKNDFWTKWPEKLD